MNRIQMLRLAILLILPASARVAIAGTASPAAKESDKFIFSLEERVRGEWRENNYDFDDAASALTDDAWLLQRLRLGVDWRPASWLRVRAEGQDVREFFSDRPNVPGILGAEGDDAFDLRQAYFELGDANRTMFSAGRMELNYGDGRLISRSPWKNVSQTFDAVKLHLGGADWWLDAFASSVVKFRNHAFNESDWLNDGGETFSGLYFSSSALKYQRTELYALQLHDRNTDFVTLGTRWKGDPKQLHGWDYEVEMAAQAGTVANKDLSAFAGHWSVGYQWMDIAWKPRVALEYSYASGDSNAADNETGTFQNLFPTNHRFYGYMDVFSWRNLSNPEVRFSVQPTDQLTATLDYHWFWLADTNDAWYRSNQTTRVRPITPGANSYAGSELDIVLAWKANEHLEVQAGLARFFAGSYLENTGASDDANFAYLSVTLIF